MQDKRVTKEQILAQLAPDMELLAQRMAEAINKADYGAIIAQSEEPVRQAHAELRKSSYQKALSLLEKHQRAFSPSADSAAAEVEE